MRLLRIGSTGPGVQLLQLALNRAGFGVLQTDGIFGPLTERAVRKFQAAQEILVDGIAGRDTHRRLLPWYTGSLLHRIRKTDTFSALAERYGTTVEAIALANPGAKPENLQIGETITVPLPFPVVPTDIDYSAALVSFCVRGLQMRYPFIGTGDIGQSVMGKPIWYLKLGSGDNAVLYNASHHANEWITTPLLLKFAEDLAAASAAGENIFDYSAAALLDYASVTLIPAVNPDGIDLVTGELQQGEFCRGAANIADDWPDIPFPAGWKANIRGTDLNLQYPAGWEEAKKNKYAQGVQGPAPMDYVGPAPLSAPESRAMYDYTLALSPCLILSYHTQGGEIYWRYGECEPEGAKKIGELFAKLSGYTLADPAQVSSNAGYKDWFIQAFDRPGFTIEAGRGKNPLPISDFDTLYKENLPILTYGALVT
ncbi:MAG: peptidoglycan-binding protein [Oscillospiraceae bacterium]|nr:peptidoglycan-binding protein [Oscillospiraceae bacterium]